MARYVIGQLNCRVKTLRRTSPPRAAKTVGAGDLLWVINNGPRFGIKRPFARKSEGVLGRWFGLYVREYKSLYDPIGRMGEVLLWVGHLRKG